MKAETLHYVCTMHPTGQRASQHP